MPLYSKLAYLGSIWGLITYIILLGTGIGSSVLLRDIMPIIQIMDTPTFQLMSSLTELVWILGIIGVAMSIIAIVSIKKIKPITKKLPIILIITSIVFIILQMSSFVFMSNVIELVTEPPYYSSTDIKLEGELENQLLQQAPVALLPSIILFVSGLLAFRNIEKN